MKIWKRILTVILCLCMVGAATGTMAMANDEGDESLLTDRAVEYITQHFQYADQCLQTDLLAGTLTEYAKTLETTDGVSFDLDGEERTLEDLCQNLQYYSDRAQDYMLRGTIDHSYPLKNYQLQVRAMDTVLEGDYCKVDLYAQRDFRYPNADFDSGAGDRCSVTFVRIGEVWYIAEVWIEGYEVYYRSTPEVRAQLREQVEYMKAHFDELCRKAELERANSGARRFHDEFMPPLTVKVMQVFKRTVYRELGVEMRQKYR